MSLKLVFFFAALLLAVQGSSASGKTDTLLLASSAKQFRVVRIGPPDYTLPPVQRLVVDSALVKKHAIDESYKNRKSIELTVNFYQNIQKLGLQLSPLESYPGDENTRPVDLETLLNATKLAGDRKMQLLVQNSLARIAVRKGDLEKAAGYLNESLLIKEGAADKAGTALITGGLAEIAKLQGKYELAIGYTQSLLSTTISAGKNIPIANAYLSLSSINSLQSNYAAAENLILRKALPTFRGNKEGRLSCFEQLADLYFIQARYSEAKWYCLQAINIADQLHLTHSQVSCLSRLAAIKNMEGDHEHALQDLRSAESIAMQNNFTERLMEIKGDMGEIYRKMGNYVVAGSFIDEYSQLSKNLEEGSR